MDRIEERVKELTKSKNVKVNKRLEGGMSHLTYLVSINNENCVVRLVGVHGNMFISRTCEYNVLKVIKDYKISNEVIFFSVKSGNKIAKYIEGTSLVDCDYTKYLTPLVDTLKILHNSKKIDTNWDFSKHLDEVEKELELISTDYYELKDLWFKDYNSNYINDELVLCHNDIQRSNIVLGKNGKIYLIDFEYACNNSIYYEIASFSNISINDGIDLLKAYFPNYNESDIKHMKFYRSFQCMMWYLVASYKEVNNMSKVLNFNFRELADKYLKEAILLYNESK
jgi:thiamine kinase-like enzyme